MEHNITTHPSNDRNSYGNASKILSKSSSVSGGNEGVLMVGTGGFFDLLSGGFSSGTPIAGKSGNINKSYNTNTNQQKNIAGQNIGQNNVQSQNISPNGTANANHVFSTQIASSGELSNSVTTQFDLMIEKLDQESVLLALINKIINIGGNSSGGKIELINPKNGKSHEGEIITSGEDFSAFLALMNTDSQNNADIEKAILLLLTGNPAQQNLDGDNQDIISQIMSRINDLASGYEGTIFQGDINARAKEIAENIGFKSILYARGNTSPENLSNINSIIKGLNSALNSGGQTSEADIFEQLASFEKMLLSATAGNAKTASTTQTAGTPSEGIIDGMTVMLLKGLPASTYNNLLASTFLSSDSILEQSGAYPIGNNLNASALSTQLITHAQQASNPHPATHAIAAQLSKATNANPNQKLSINLNPPELGKVEISMQINTKNKAVKAMMLIEKPETFLMLQRDSQILEKALQNAGLEVDGQTIEFELAKDGNEFTQNGSHDDNTGGASGNNSGDEEISDIELHTEMNWYTDPHTGILRYSMLV